MILRCKERKNCHVYFYFYYITAPLISLSQDLVYVCMNIHKHHQHWDTAQNFFHPPTRLMSLRFSFHLAGCYWKSLRSKLNYDKFIVEGRNFVVLNWGEDITAVFMNYYQKRHIHNRTYRNRQFYFASAATFITEYLNMCNNRCMNSHEIAQKRDVTGIQKKNLNHFSFNIKKMK